MKRVSCLDCACVLSDKEKFFLSSDREDDFELVVSRCNRVPNGPRINLITGGCFMGILKSEVE